MADESVEIKPGDQIFRLARLAGFRSIQPITDAAANKTLLKQRVNPGTLVAGDVLVIPTLDPKQGPAAVNRFTTFTLVDSGVFLNLRLQDTERRPLARRAIRLVVADNNPAGGLNVAEPIDDVTGPKGELSEEIPPFIIEGELVVHETDDPASPPIQKIKILVGVLESANTIKGQQARLNNMGYFAGFSEKDLDQLRWAIEEFQVDHKLPVNGRFDDPTTFNKIAHEHGDLLPNEKVP